MPRRKWFSIVFAICSHGHDWAEALRGCKRMVLAHQHTCPICHSNIIFLTPQPQYEDDLEAMAEFDMVKLFKGAEW